MAENGELIEAAHENMNLGLLHNTLQYQLQLQQNLIYLATHADDSPDLVPIAFNQDGREEPDSQQPPQDGDGQPQQPQASQAASSFSSSSAAAAGSGSSSAQASASAAAAAATAVATSLGRNAKGKRRVSDAGAAAAAAEPAAA